MQDYLDSTSNVIAAALSTDALTGDKPYYTGRGRRIGRLTLLTAGLLIYTLDVATDCFNYGHATWRSWGKPFREPVDEQTAIFTNVFFGICLFGSLLLLATLCLTTMQFISVGRRRTRTPHLELLEELLHMASLTLHDAPMVALLTTSVLARFCPLVEQMRTTPGQVALASTGVSLVFRAVHSLGFCCSCRGERRSVSVTLLTLVLRVTRTLLLALTAVSFLLTVMVAFTPDPNRLTWLRSVFTALDLGDGSHGPVYLYQKYDIPYTIRRLVDKDDTNLVLPPAEDYRQWSAQRLSGLTAVDHDCDHYTRRVYIGDSSEIIKAGPSGLSRSYPCSEANPYIKTSLPGEFQSLLLNHTCTMTFKLTYDVHSVSLALQTEVTLTPSENMTSASSPACVEMALSSETHNAPVITAWPSLTINAVKDYECAHSYECPGRLPPFHNPHRKPYFSCLTDTCRTRSRGVARDQQLRGAQHQFTYTSYKLVLPSTHAFFPCLLSVTSQSWINAGDCGAASQSGTPSTQTSENQPGTQSPASKIQVLSCPESPFA